MRIRPLQIATLALTACILLAGLDRLFWLHAETRLREQLATTRQTLGTTGWATSCTRQTPGGWPFTATLTLENPRLTHKTPRTTLAWGAHTLTLSLSPLHPTTLALSVPGQHALALSTSTLTLNATATSTRIIPNNHTLPFTSQTLSLAWNRNGQENAVTLFAPTGTLFLHPDAPPDQTRLALTLNAPTLTIPLLPAWLHHWPTQNLALTLAGTAPTTGTDQTFQKILIQNATLQTGPLHFTLAGTLTTTPQQDGRATLQITGLPEAATTWFGTIAPHLDDTTRERIQSMLGRLPLRENQTLSLPLTLRNGQILIGATPLTKMFDIHLTQP